MGLFSSSWERQVDNNLFDYIDVDQFKNNRVGTVWNYLVMIFLLFLAIVFYCIDIYTCIKLLAFNEWSSEVKPYLSFKISKWLFAACIICSVVLLIYESIRGFRVFKTRNISLIYTNTFAKNAKSLQGYKYFCVLNEINPSSGFEKMAFYTYFTFHGSKKLLLADSPRQIINALTLYSVLNIKNGFLDTIKAISENSRNEAIILSTMTASFVIWLFFIFQFFFAVVFAIPVYYRVLHTLQFQTLRQYVCIKVDKTVKKLAKHHQKKSLEKLTLENQKRYKPTLPDIDPLKFTPTVPEKPSTFTSINSLQSSRTYSDSTTLKKPSTFSSYNVSSTRTVSDNPFADSQNQLYEMTNFKEAVAKPLQSAQHKPSINSFNTIRNDSFANPFNPVHHSASIDSINTYHQNPSLQSLTARPEPVHYNESTYSLGMRPDFGGSSVSLQSIGAQRQMGNNSDSSTETSNLVYPKRTDLVASHSDPESLARHFDSDLSDLEDDNDGYDNFNSTSNLTGGSRKNVRPSLIKRAKEMDSEDYTRFRPTTQPVQNMSASNSEISVFQKFNGRKVLR